MQELEKILYELEKRIFTAEVYNDDFDGTTITNLICLGDVRDILEKHMNDGWIPVEECLPENNKLVLVWARSTARGADEWSLGSYDNGFWALGSYGGSLVFPSQLEAVAWRPLPDPYRPERSDNYDRTGSD